MKKPVKLLVYLLISAVILFFLWARAECPRLTAQGALNRLESSNLAPKSKFVSAHSLGTLNSNGTNYQRYMVAGVTDTHLHLSEIWKGGFLWHRSSRLTMPLVSLPLEDAMVGIAPDTWPFDCSFFCYTVLPAQSWKARLTVGGFSCQQEGQCDPSGFTVFEFQILSAAAEQDILDPWITDNIRARVYDMTDTGYDKAMKSRDITLEITLYDGDGAELARAVRDYPVT